VLADLLPRDIARTSTLVLSGALFTALLSQISIPLLPVPITGQTLAVLLVGASLGAVRGGAALLTYAVLGFIGMPFYAPEADGSHLSGMAAVATPSFGYIIGFIPAAALVGYLSERKWDREFLRALAIFAGGSLVVFAFGLPWLAVATGANFTQTLEWGLYPFLVGGLVKALIASAVLPTAWWGAKRLSVWRSGRN